MTSSPEDLSLRVAKRYALDNVWSLDKVKKKYPNDYHVIKLLHRKDELVRNVFSASFSRSLKNLEKKGLVQLVRGHYRQKYENGEFVYYRIITTQQRISFIVHHKSPYFGRDNPDIDFLCDVVKSIHRPSLKASS